jgi:hypothetical protein
MGSPEYLVIEESFIALFVEKMNEASEDGFMVVSSNNFHIIHDNNGHVQYETLYYVLMVKNPVKPSNDFHYKILDDLNEIKYELKEVVKNLKYLGE